MVTNRGKGVCVLLSFVSLTDAPPCSCVCIMALGMKTDLTDGLIIDF